MLKRKRLHQDYINSTKSFTLVPKTYITITSTADLFMRRFMKLLFLFPCLLLSSIAFCQNAIGIPHIRNFSNRDYNAGTQNWDIRQDKTGIMYFANNDGLLTYDGTNWKTFPLPKRTNVRSLEIDGDKLTGCSGN